MQADNQNPSLTQNAVLNLLNPEQPNPSVGATIAPNVSRHFDNKSHLYNPLDEPILVKLLTVKPNSSADSTVARNFHLCKICDEDYEIDAIIFDSARLGHGHGSGSGSHTSLILLKSLDMSPARQIIINGVRVYLIHSYASPPMRR